MSSLNNVISIDRRMVLNHIGYIGEHLPKACVTLLVDDYIENYHDLFSPSLSYKIMNIVSVKGNSSIIEDSVIFESKIIARLLESCEKIVVFVLTIGNNLEKEVNRLVEKRLLLQALILDAIGSLAVEQLALFTEEKIRELVSPDGFRISRRFSPGYCDWAISQQKMIFRAIGDKSAGILLTEKFLMIPQKSISGVIGLSRGNIEDYNPCDTCKRNGCPGRR